MYTAKFSRKLSGLLRKLSYKMFYKFLLLSIVPLSLMSLSNLWSYNYFLNHFKNEATQSSMESLVQISEDMRQIFNELFQTNRLGYMSQNLMNFLITNDPDIKNDPLKLLECYNDLLLLRNTKESIDHIFIYNRNIDFVVSTKGTSSAENFFNADYQYENYPETFWKNLDLKNYEVCILPPCNINVINYPSMNLYMSKSIIPVVQTEIGPLYTRNLFVTNISEKDLNSMLKNNAATPNSFTIITDTEGNIYTSSDIKYDYDTQKTEYSIEKYCRAESGSYDDSINSENYIVIVHKSSILAKQFVFISYVPYKDIYAQISHTRNITSIINVVVLFISIFISLWYAKKVYSPIERLVNTIKNHQGEENLHSENSDLYYIESSYQNAVSNYHVMSNKYNSVLPMALEQYMLKVLNSNDMFFDEQFIGLLSTSQYGFQYPYFCAVAIQLNFTKLFYDSFSREDQLRIFNSIISLSSSFFPVEIPVLTLTSDINQIYLIINMQKTESTQNIEMALSTFYRLFEFDKDYHQMYIGIGLIQKDLQGLCLSYKQAIKAVNTLSPFSNNKIAVYNEENINYGYYYSAESENKLYNYLMSGQKDAVLLLLKDILRKNEMAGITSRYTTELYHRIYLTGVNVLTGKGLTPSEIMGEEYIDFASESALLSSNQMINYLSDFLNRIAGLSTGNKTNKIDPKDIKQYIFENYDKDIYLEQLADTYHVSLAHLSRIVKKELGMTFSTYLAQVRIQRAKELLTTTNKTINDISEAVGFNSRNTFIRMFKKLEGITPSTYRASMR